VSILLSAMGHQLYSFYTLPSLLSILLWSNERPFLPPQESIHGFSSDREAVAFSTADRLKGRVAVSPLLQGSIMSS